MTSFGACIRSARSGGVSWPDIPESRHGHDDRLGVPHDDRPGEKALELGGGAGFFRSTGLERTFRDLQGVRYHPLTEKGQTDLTGRVLLG